MKIKHAKSDIIFNSMLVVLCVFIAVAILYPLYFICIASFSHPSAVANGDTILLPKRITFAGYEEIFQDARIWNGYKNTILYTFLGTALSIVFTVSAAYTLSRKDLKTKGFLMFFFTFTMFFNGGLIPTYLTVKQFNMDNTIWVMIIPFSVNVFNLIIARTYFQNSIADELLEASQLDGCSDFRFFLQIALPLSKAILTVLALYYMVGYWNEYFRALVFLRDNSLFPLQLILRDILVRNQSFAAGSAVGVSAEGNVQQRADLIKYGVIVVSSLPIIALYPFVQKYFEKGVMIGSLKG